MKILISNDDGVYAKGLSVLAHILGMIGEITIVAPDRNRSGASNSLTLMSPVRVTKLENGSYSVEGTPTDCVHLAMTGLFKDERPYDMVISGINEGANLGDDILYSGTVAAATEGRFLGLPAVAVSLVGKKNYHTAAVITKQIITQLMQEPLPFQTILNVNVPDLPLAEIRGIQITRLGARHKSEPVVKTQDPRGNDIYWIGPSGPESDAGEGTDFFAIAHGFVSITPLSFDLTNYKAFEQLSSLTAMFATV